jgi:hypothetical protein
VCGKLRGACCSISPQTGRATCTDNLTRVACASRRGQFTYGKKCKDVLCTAGACCVRNFEGFDGGLRASCLSAADKSICTALAAELGPLAVGEFTAGDLCSAVECLDMRGACCTVGASGKPTCSMTTMSSCQETPGEARCAGN